ncbi:MAG: trypsin-like peptidase domain-containing protein [Myxococcales bacterium]|nr:trypsin-like peptidase domain-containing protein [Myxococcales bacterium]
MATALGAVAILGTLALTGAGCRERVLTADDAGPAGASDGRVGAAPPPTQPTAPLAAVLSGVEPPPTRLAYTSGSFVELVAAARPAVVALRARAPVKSGPAAMLPGAPDAVADVALGTGFLIDSKGPHILTTDRIASAAGELVAVLSDGSEAPAKLIGRDPRLDLALLSVELPAALRVPALPLGNSDQLAVGEWLVVLGNAFGDEVTATAGLVSATGREAAASIAPGPAMGFRTMLQTDARIHRGNSGGPVLSTAGQVVGVALATSDRPTELSFAIPINRVREVLDSLRDHGQVTRAWLGALVKPVTVQQATALGLPRPTGALVTQLVAGSPAASSPLRVGDVVLRWDGRDVDHRTLPWLVAGTAPGRPVPVTVRRGAASLDLEVTTAPMPQ